MATIARLDVLLGLNADKFTRGLQKSRKSIDEWGKSLRDTGKTLTAFASVPIGGFFVAAFNGASDLEQAMGKVDLVFGKTAKDVITWSENSADAFGLSQSSALAAIGTFGQMFQSMGKNREQSAQMSENILQMAADWSAFSNIPVADVLDMISAGLIGEYDGLQRLIPNISAAAVEHKALEMGLADNSKQLTQADKALAAYNLIMDESAPIAGQFARESTGAAGSLAIFRANLSEAVAALGKTFLPVASSALQTLTGWAKAIKNLDPAMQRWIVVILAVVAALGPLLIALGLMLPGIAALLSPIGLLITAAALLAFVFREPLFDGIKDLIKQFIDLREMGFSPLDAVLAMIGGRFESLVPILNTIRDVVTRLKAAWDEGGLLGVLRALPGAIGDVARSIGTTLLNAIQGIDWSAVVNGLGDLSAALAFWVLAKATAVDWGGLIAAAASTAGDITATIVSKLGDLFQALFNWVWTSASAVQWGELIGAAAASAGDITATIISKIGDLGAALKTWYDNAINDIDWYNLGNAIGEKIGDLTMVLAPKAGELVQGFLTALVNPDLWAGIAMAIFTMIIALPAVIGYIGTTMAPKALEFVQGFVDGLNINWITVTVWLAALPIKLREGVGSLATTLLQTGMDAIQGLWEGITNKWTFLSAWLATLPALAVAAIGVVLRTLHQQGMDLFAGLWDGIKDKWASVKGWLAGTPGYAVDAVGDLTRTLRQQGVDLFMGWWDGIKDQWATVKGWLQGTPGYSVDAVGDLSRTLRAQGVDLFAGWWDGIKDQWATVKGWLQGLDGYAVTAVGDLGRTLHQAGVSLLFGMYDGILDQWAAVKGWLGGLGGYIAGAVPDLGRVLYGAGADAVQGLINGATDKLSGLQNVVNSIINIWNQIPLLGNSPWPMMIEAAHDAMDGLVIGVDHRMATLAGKIGEVIDLFASARLDLLTNTLGGVLTPTIDNSRMAPLPIPTIDNSRMGQGGGETHNHYYYSVTPEDLRQLIDNADAGGEFARNFGAELAARGGSL